MVKVGDKVRIVMNTSSHEFKLGDIVVLHEDRSRLGGFKAYYPDGSDYWYVNETDVAPTAYTSPTPYDTLKQRVEHHMERGEYVRAVKWAQLAEQAKELENESP